MTGYQSKRNMAQDKLAQPAQEPRLDQGPDYERGFVDGMQKQMQSSVDKAVNRMAQRSWVSLTEADLKPICDEWRIVYGPWVHDFARDIEAKLKERNA